MLLLELELLKSRNYQSEINRFYNTEDNNDAIFQSLFTDANSFFCYEEEQIERKINDIIIKINRLYKINIEDIQTYYNKNFDTGKYLKFTYSIPKKKAKKNNSLLSECIDMVHSYHLDIIEIHKKLWIDVSLKDSDRKNLVQIENN